MVGHVHPGQRTHRPARLRHAVPSRGPRPLRSALGQDRTDPPAMTRIEHYNDPNAPRPTSLVPAASAVVADEDGRILLARRRDNGLWTIPGGGMEPGETIAQTAVREVKEE